MPPSAQTQPAAPVFLLQEPPVQLGTATAVVLIFAIAYLLPLAIL